MAEALEVGDQRGQSRADQAALGNVFRQVRLVGLGAAVAPVFGTGVLLDVQLGRFDIDLLDDAGQGAAGTQLAATAGAAGQLVCKELVDLLVWEEGAFVFGMTGLAPALAFVLARRWRRWRRLDDVRRRRLGGTRGVLAGSGELLRQTSHAGLHLLQLRALLLQLRLQPLASGTGSRCCFCHALVLLPVRLSGYQAVNAYPKTITVVPDEHFHSGRPCLVAIEPVSNFIAVECYRDCRDAATWNEAIAEGKRGLPVEIVQMTSDLARALVCCAEKGFAAAHSPDLFHGQRDLLQPLLLPLARPIQQADKDLEKAARHANKLDAPLEEPCSEAELLALIEAVKTEQALGEQLEQAKERKAEAVQQVRGVGDDYHPFDRQTGKPVTAEEVGQRLNSHLDQLAAVVQEAGLGERAEQAVQKSRTWVGTLMGCVAWFWSLVNARVEAMDLSAEQEQQVREQLLAGHYWAMAAPRRERRQRDID